MVGTLHKRAIPNQLRGNILTAADNAAEPLHNATSTLHNGS
jgi:hypothetical protein